MHLAKAYGVSPVAKASPVRAPETAARIEPSVAGTSRTPAPELIAGFVPGGIDFSGAEPTPKAPAHQLYRHPADKNAVATAMQAGKMLDIQG